MLLVQPVPRVLLDLRAQLVLRDLLAVPLDLKVPKVILVLPEPPVLLVL